MLVHCVSFSQSYHGSVVLGHSEGSSFTLWFPTSWRKLCINCVHDACMSSRMTMPWSTGFIATAVSGTLEVSEPPVSQWNSLFSEEHYVELRASISRATRLGDCRLTIKVPWLILYSGVIVLYVTRCNHGHG